MLRKIIIPRASKPIEVAPHDEKLGRGSITVICGKNNSGKSYILRKINEIINNNFENTHNTQGWEIERTNSDSVYTSLHVAHHKNFMGNLGILNANAALSHPDRKSNFYLFMKVSLFSDIISLSGLDEFDREMWSKDGKYRHEFISGIQEDEEKVYWCDLDDGPEYIKFFSKISHSHLGFRKTKDGLEVCISNNGICSPYPNICDGYKSILTLFSCINFINPDVLLFDEIENYFHPEFISSALNFLRKKVKQSILSSHHPHLIFGRYVDKVVYIEPINVKSYSQDCSKPFKQKSPKREIICLENDIQKLATTYKLFDIKDSVLLSLSQTSNSLLLKYIKNDIYSYFSCEAYRATSRPLPDLQSDSVKKILDELSIKEGVILDYGAGELRLFYELMKTNFILSDGDFRWIFLDKEYKNIDSDINREENFFFACNFEEVCAHFKIVNLSMLINVFHVLSFDDSVAVLYNIFKITRGYLLLSEIFPLLNPELGSIAYPPEYLVEFFRRIGLEPRRKDIRYKNMSDIYFIYCKIEKSISRRKIKSELVRLYNDVKRHSLRHMYSIENINSVESYNEVINMSFNVSEIERRLYSD